MIGILYSHQVPIQYTTNLAKSLKSMGFFSLKRMLQLPCGMFPLPLNLALATRPLTKLKENLPRFLGNNTVTTNEHLVAFSNACHNIGSNENNTCVGTHIYI
jgi:hypothetical protein